MSTPNHVQLLTVLRIKPNEELNKLIELNEESYIDSESSFTLNDSNIRSIENNTIHLKNKDSSEEYKLKCDRIIDKSSTQNDIFNMLGSTLVDKCIHGENSCLITFGAKNTGKTFTLFGKNEENSFGLIPRTISSLMKSNNIKISDNQMELVTSNIFVSFYEIYDNKINDLLPSKKEFSPPRGKTLQLNEVKVRENIDTTISIEGLKILEIESFNSEFDILSMLTNNGVQSIYKNSHKVITIYLNQIFILRSNNKKTIRSSRISFYDINGFSNDFKDSKSYICSPIERLFEDLSISSKFSLNSSSCIISRLLKDNIMGNITTYVLGTIDDHYDNSIRTMRCLGHASMISVNTRLQESLIKYYDNEKLNVEYLNKYKQQFNRVKYLKSQFKKCSELLNLSNDEDIDNIVTHIEHLCLENKILHSDNRKSRNASRAMIIGMTLLSLLMIYFDSSSL